MTLKAAAPLLGVSWQHLSLMETGHHPVSAHRLDELLAAYDGLSLGGEA